MLTRAYLSLEVEADSKVSGVNVQNMCECQTPLLLTYVRLDLTTGAELLPRFQAGKAAAS